MNMYKLAVEEPSTDNYNALTTETLIGSSKYISALLGIISKIIHLCAAEYIPSKSII